jgi:hypothetical protein
MRISIPTRFQPKYVILFIALVFVGQELEGTNIIFALLTALYNGLWATAFNTAGGVAYPSGAFILANGLFSVVIGFAAKVLLFEPGERNMMDPIGTMLCYCLGMGMILGVAYLTRVLRPLKPFLPPMDNLRQMKQGSIACLIVGLILVAVTGLGLNSSGSLLSALHQIAGFPEMAIILATTYEIRRTQGKRSLNWVTAVSIGIGIVYGLVYFGKTPMLAGVTLWAITAAVQGYNFKKGQVIGVSLAFLFMVYYMVPYSQYVRHLGSSTGSLRENIPVAIEYLADLPRTRKLYMETVSESDVNDGPHLYDRNEGFLDRLIIVAVDDDLIHYTNEGNVFGLTPTLSSIGNLVPHLLWKDKPDVNSGNDYAHELGLLPDEDHTTGIAISITADAYHQLKWLGILLVMPCALLFCLLICDSVAGNGTISPFAILPIFELFNEGVSSGVGGPIRLGTYGIFNLLLIYWVTMKFTPFVLNTIWRSGGPGLRTLPGGRIPAPVSVSRLDAPRPGAAAL